MDEHVQAAITHALRDRGVDVLTVQTTQITFSFCRSKLTGHHFLSPSVRSRLYAALMSDRCVSACGKLPNASPWAPVSSA
ncbi:MAG: hypothetical protein JWN24_1501 [Phycisphaerales bacterium]|nr:hypothetical protein [Phycisphaerales bacterium]